MAVTTTENAARAVRDIMKEQDLDPETIRLRVGVKGGGCSGFSYLLDLTEKKRDTDEVWEYEFTFEPAETPAAKDSEGGQDGQDGQGGIATAAGGPAEAFTLRIVCDPKSYLYLNGTVIDFKDELMGRGFVFNNPNATSTCGCGSSFSA